MICPVCENEHNSRPIQCLQRATQDHLVRCGIKTEHSGDCKLKLLNVYVEANPQWKTRDKTAGG